ncbi:MAG: tetratricopeptide repeat protein [Polyangiaceae bacterium]|jgi:tetratricopeptide (TPR) repeat protein|nr:tetratricopeptide repeat protein [Polyangiaceae bacterium]MBK8938938.1 tetratricopeptide repeat protein [Polyangiaceae bacterium]
MRSRARVAAVIAALIVPLWVQEAHAVDADEALVIASGQVSSVQGGVGAIKAAVAKSQSKRTPAQQIADAVLLMGAKDYDRAANLLNQVIEKHADHPTAYPDALGLLGEVYFRSNQLWSSRRVFQKITASSSDPRFQPYLSKSLARLVDIAMRKKDDALLTEVIASIDTAPASATSLLGYARGKALLAKKDYVTAKSVLSGIDEKSEYGHQARYLLGLIAVKESTPAPVKLEEGQDPPPVPKERYAGAIDLFTKVTQLPPDTEAHRMVIDQAWLAVGRLFYETNQLNPAIAAYNKIDRTSPEFGTMLYELAWVYVKLGDADRALRALEVLAVADPKGQNIADGTLLRGDLMLRAGKFDKALATYEGFKATYEPMRDKVEAFLASTSDPGAYYDKLTKKEFETLDTSSLPPVALEWARDAEDGEAAFGVVDDISECRDLLAQSNDMIEKLNAVLSSPAKVRAFPELKGGLERAVGMLNKTALARLTLAEGLEDTDDDDLGGEVGQVRSARRQLEARLKKLPTTDADFATREVDAERQWNKVSQATQRLELQMNQNQAIINGLRRVITEGGSLGVVQDPTAIAAWEAQIKDEETKIGLYKQQIEAMRKQIQSGRVTAGFGDQRFVEDELVRLKYGELLKKELELLSGGAGGGGLQKYSQKALPIVKQAEDADAQVSAAKAELDKEVENQTSGVFKEVAAETEKVVGYQVRLEELDGQARLLVGEVMMRNFGFVRDRLKSMILRADVGITQQAWEVREDQITRVRTLTRERAQQDRVLREELNEVLDDAGEAPAEEETK